MLLTILNSSKLMETPPKPLTADLPTDRLSATEVTSVLAGADFEVRQILGHDTFGMTSMLLKYHGVVSCLKQEASINASVLPSNQIPLRM